MSKLEQIVRPSQDGLIRPSPAAGYQAPPIIPNGNTVTWGSAGNDIFQVSAHVSQSINNPWPKSDETQRKYDVARVKNPDDHDQHVDVEAMTEYQARNKIDKSRITLRYAKMNPTEGNIEILSSDNVRKQTVT